MGEWKERVAFLFAIAVIALATAGTVTHYKRAYPKSVTATVTSPRLELPAFQPFAFWGVTPTHHKPVPLNWQPARFGILDHARRAAKRKWVCADRLNTFPPRGRAEVCGYSVFWI